MNLEDNVQKLEASHASKLEEELSRYKALENELEITQRKAGAAFFLCE